MAIRCRLQGFISHVRAFNTSISKEGSRAAQYMRGREIIVGGGGG
ncbi:hypothetical protein VTH06DRAFT_1456 [Thermothelomyces fergusii]